MKPEGEVFDGSWRARTTVEATSKAEADWMIRRHYIGKWPGVVVAIIGLKVDKKLLGVVVYALPPRETFKRYGGVTWELARLWLDDSLPTNAETFLISRSVRLVRRMVTAPVALVSYADPSAGHQGIIYRAANWTPDGRTDDERKTPRFDYACATTGKKFSRRGHVPDGTKIVRVARVSKPRFYLTLK